jgi:hypothetical protein
VVVKGRQSGPSAGLPGLEPQAYAPWRASWLGVTTERREREVILSLDGEVAGQGVLASIAHLVRRRHPKD